MRLPTNPPVVNKTIIVMFKSGAVTMETQVSAIRAYDGWVEWWTPGAIRQHREVSILSFVVRSER